MERIAVGCSVVDITPAVGIPLSGFIARIGKPSTGIADPFHMRALGLRSKEEVYFLLNYDLLLVGAILKEKIFAALTEHLGSVFSPKCCIIAATHTHIGPSGMPLEGEPDAPED